MALLHAFCRCSQEAHSSGRLCGMTENSSSTVEGCVAMRVLSDTCASVSLSITMGITAAPKPWVV